MEAIWLQLALVLALVALNAFFAGSEIALISLTEGQLRRIEDEHGAAGRRLAQLARSPNRFLATIQVGITLAGFLASATAAVSLAQPLVPALDFLGGAAEPVAIVAITLALAYLTLVLGELAPKRIAMQRAERWALMATRPLTLLGVVARPVVALLGWSTDLVVRLVGASPSAGRADVTEEEVRDLIASHRAFTPFQREVLAGALEARDRSVRDVQIPRTAVFALRADEPVPEAFERMAQTGHTRAPVYGRDLDDVVGTVHLIDLKRAEGTVGEHARPAVAFPETVGVLEALRRMQRARAQMALVVDEHGGLEGIVTVEDLLEELVGDISDEFDTRQPGVTRGAGGEMLVPGGYPIHDLPDLGVALPEGDYSTVAGLILHRLGRIPAVGESVEVENWRLTVTGRNGVAIRRVRIEPAGARDSADGAA